MAVPTVTADITQIDACDVATAFDSWGVGVKFAAEPDIYIEGSGSVGLPVKNTGDGGYGPVGFTSFNANNYLILIWVFAIPGFISTTSPCYIRVGSNGDFTNHYGDFNIGDRDAAWVNGAWRLFALDVGRGADSTTGSPNYAAVDAIGFGANYVATSSKASVTAVDNIMYGNYVEITGVTSSSANHAFTAATKTITRSAGSFSSDGFEIGDTIEISGTASNDGFYTLATVGTTTMTTNEALVDEASVASNIDGFITFADIIAQDTGVADNWYGVVTVNRDGQYEINYDLRIGDQSGTARTAFISRGEQVIFTDQPLDTANNAALVLKTYEDTGANTKFIVGQSTGTGDSRVGFGGSVFSQFNDVFTENAKIDLTVAIDAMEFFGSTLLDIGLGALFAADTTHLLTNVTFSDCGQSQLGSVEARNIVFANYSPTSDGALLWNSSIDIELSQFFANDRAIEHDTAGTYNYTDLTFSGNTYDVASSVEATLVDSYQPTEDGDVDVYSGSITRVAQQFTATAGDLSRAIWSIRKQGSPTGNVYAKLYANSGGAPTGTALAQSNAVDIAGLTTSFADVDFEFEDEYTMSATDYHISIEYTGGDASNRLEVEYLTAGDVAETCNTYVSSWSGQTYDCRFQVNRDGIVKINAGGTVTPSNPNTTIITATVKGAIIIVNTKTLTVNVEDEDGNPVQNARVRIENQSTGAEISQGYTNASGVYQDATYNYTIDTDVTVKVRKSSAYTRYYPWRTNDTITTNGLTINATLIEDTIAEYFTTTTSSTTTSSTTTSTSSTSSSTSSSTTTSSTTTSSSTTVSSSTSSTSSSTTSTP